jgi:hypothetical protein
MQHHGTVRGCSLHLSLGNEKIEVVALSLSFTVGSSIHSGHSILLRARSKLAAGPEA